VQAPDFNTGSTGWIASLSSGITMLGFGAMYAVRQYMGTRRANAADQGVTSAYELLTSENKRLSLQLADLSLLVNKNLTEKLELVARVGELERKLGVMGDLEKENAELREEVAQIRAENHELRDKLHTLELQMAVSRT
jgi:cell division protein FtsB